MFKVEIHLNNYYWAKFAFEFETLEEAQQFVQSAMSHFVKEKDDDDMVVSIELRQKFTTAKEEDDESNTCD